MGMGSTAMVLTCSLHGVCGGEGGNESIKMSDVRTIFADKSTLTKVAAYCLTGQAAQALVFLNQPRFISIGISTQVIGIVTAASQMLCMMSARSYDIARKIGENAFLVITSLTVSVCFAAFAYSRSASAVIISYMLINAFTSFQWPVLEVIKNRAVRSENRATILSIYSLLYSAIGIVMNLTLSRLTTLSTSYPFMFLIVLTLAGSAGYLASVKKDSCSG